MRTKLISASAFIASMLLIASLIVVSCSKDEVEPLSQDDQQASRLKSVSWNLVKASNPTADQKDAYTKITTAMNAAVSMYNGQTSVTKSITVYYEPSVATADGNINGTIRFGSNRSYMTQCTAMHEIGHTLGVGTSSKWTSLMVNGVWKGANATAMIRSMVGESSTSVIKGDRTHFWPYGLNYNSEWSTVNGQRHARIVGAMKKDGM
jgi:hypothetical protein